MIIEEKIFSLLFNKIILDFKNCKDEKERSIIILKYDKLLLKMEIYQLKKEIKKLQNNL